MAALYVWTWILFQLSRIGNFLLKIAIKTLPNIMLPDMTPKIPIKIIKAIDESGFDITKKLKMFMNFKWDKTHCDDEGGVDLDTFSEYIGSSIIMVAYIFDYDFNDEICDKFLEIIKSDDRHRSVKQESGTEFESESDSPTEVDYPIRDPVGYFKKCIRLVAINTSKKILYKIKKDTLSLNTEDILFGEVDFH